MGMFDHIDKLGKGLDASWLRNEVITNNISNVDTPDFNRSYVAFESVLAEELANKSDFMPKKTRSQHVDFGFDPSTIPMVVTDYATTMRMDGNNVDIEQEMADMAKNSIYYNFLSDKVNGEITRLRKAIAGGK